MILSVENLVKEYRRRGRTTFRLEASFSVERPEIVGVMGPNGSGKTTLFELITGSNLPSEHENHPYKHGYFIWLM